MSDWLTLGYVLVGALGFVVIGDLIMHHVLSKLATSRYCPLWLAKECWEHDWECGRPRE